MREHKDAEAVPHLQAALDQSPDDATVARQLVGALVRLGRADAAIATLNRMRASDGDDEDALLGLVILLSDQQRYREALVLLDDANRRAPDRPTTATTLARLLASAPDRSLRDGRRALELATEVHASDPAPVHAETVAMALAELERCDEARAWMTRAVTAAQAAARRRPRSRACRAAAPAVRAARRAGPRGRERSAQSSVFGLQSSVSLVSRSRKKRRALSPRARLSSALQDCSPKTEDRRLRL